METLKHGYYTRDRALRAGIYSDDVEFTICNRNNLPDKRLVLRGARQRGRCWTTCARAR
jgi:hypothetical protein